MKQYPKYKDSGIQWIGQIPEGWNVLRFKHCFNTSTGMSIAKSDLTESGVAVISYGQIHAKTNTRTHLSDDLLRYIPCELIKGGDTCKLRKNDIVFADTSEDLEGCGNAAFIDTDQEVFAGYHTIIARPIIEGEIKYLAYLFNTPVWRQQLRENVAGIKVYSITQKLLNDSCLLLPPVSEQESIVRYLDDKTAKIDDTVNLLEQQKTDLQQYRKALISQTVTRGLNPNAKLKDSGIQWIGQIPEEWETSRIKDIIDTRSGINLPSEKILSQGKYPVYGGNGIRGYYLEYSNEGDFILIGRQGALCGNINYASGRFWATEHAVVCYPKKNLALKWLGELLRTMNLGQYSISAAQPGLSMERIKNLPIPLPPISEQQAIADFLDSKTATIDQSITNIETQIADLRAYRTALISDVVNGKIDVRN